MNTSMLENGSKLLTLKKHSEICSFYIYVKIGSIYETQKEKGIAHYLEHLVFKGSKNYKGVGTISKKLDSFGADFNAYTTKDITCFHCTVSSDNIGEVVKILLDMVHNPILDENDFEKERTVIIEEINRSLDNPKFMLEDKIYEQVYGKQTPYGYSIAGYENDIRNLSYGDLIKFKNKYYKSSNMCFVLVGNFNKNILDLFTIYQNKEIVNKPLINVTSNKGVHIVTKKDMKQVQICFAWPIINYSHKDKYVLNIISNILGGGMSSRLFTELREKRGMSYSIDVGSTCYTHTGIFTIYTAIDDKRVFKDGLKIGGLQVILNEVRKLKKTKISKSELKRQKQYIIGQSKIAFEDNETLAEYYGEELVYNNNIISIKKLLDIYDNITCDDVIKTCNKYLDKDRMSLLLIGNVVENSLNDTFNF